METAFCLYDIRLIKTFIQPPNDFIHTFLFKSDQTVFLAFSQQEAWIMSLQGISQLAHFPFFALLKNFKRIIPAYPNIKPPINIFTIIFLSRLEIDKVL